MFTAQSLTNNHKTELLDAYRRGNAGEGRDRFLVFETLPGSYANDHTTELRGAYRRWARGQADFFLREAHIQLPRNLGRRLPAGKCGARERLPALGSEGKRNPRRFAPGVHTLDEQTLVGSVGSQRVLTASALSFLHSALQFTHVSVGLHGSTRVLTAPALNIRPVLCHVPARQGLACFVLQKARSTPTPGALAFADSRSPSSQTRRGGA